MGATNATLTLLGAVPVDDVTYRALHCVPIPEFYRLVLGRLLTVDEQAAAEGKFTRYPSRRPVRLRDGAAALLADLRDSGHTQSLQSLLPHERLMAETAEAGVSDLFDRIDGRHRPGGTKAEALAAHLIHQPGHSRGVLLIGDTSDDAHPARAVGARAVLVTGGLEEPASLHRTGTAVGDNLHQPPHAARPRAGQQQGRKTGTRCAGSAHRPRTGDLSPLRRTR
ncbi:HAD family hydrolase [Streptomyces sp. NPDC006643]|uniref:HAD family hydrolase n=1 Tax=Streptomyces sp. NPDC006643 TaxID=3364756 RepID=UPI003680DCEE